jgi:hypothetical protein
MALLPDMMASDWGKSEDPKDAPMLRAIGSDRIFYEWMAAPGNEETHARFSAAMIGYAQLYSPDDITSGTSIDVRVARSTEWSWM